MQSRKTLMMNFKVYRKAVLFLLLASRRTDALSCSLETTELNTTTKVIDARVQKFVGTRKDKSAGRCVGKCVAGRLKNCQEKAVCLNKHIM